MTRSRSNWLALVLILTCAAPVAAHPIGMQSVDHYSRLEIERDRIRVIYDLDMAEIATVLEFKRIDTNGDGEASDAEKTAFAAVRARELADGLRLEINGQRLALTPMEAKAFIRTGENNLPTLRLIAPLETAPGALTAALRGAGPQTATYRDDNEDDRAGWRQIGLAAPGGQIIDRTIAGQLASAGPEDYVVDAKGDKTNVRQVEFHFAIAPLLAAPPLVSAEPVPAPRVARTPAQSRRVWPALIVALAITGVFLFRRSTRKA